MARGAKPTFSRRAHVFSERPISIEMFPSPNAISCEVTDDSQSQKKVADLSEEYEDFEELSVCDLMRVWTACEDLFL